MIANLLLRGAMLMQRLGPWRRLRQAAKDPESSQLGVLRRILHDNRDTEYGRRHGYAGISSYQDFARAVPIVDFEDLRSYIESQMQSGAHALTASQPVMYAHTSGTTGTPKLVPLVEAELQGQKRHMGLLTWLQYDCDRRAFAGKLWAMAAAAEEGRLDNGVPYGSASGFLYAHMPRAVRDKFLVPHEVFGIRNSDLKYRAILRLALAEPGITYLNAPNPSTLARLIALANAWGPELADEIEAGSFGAADELPPGFARSMHKKLRADPGRARELRAIFGRGQPASFAELWPGLRMVCTWTGGNCGVALDSVRALLPAATRVVELGYLSSEFRGSLTVDCETGAGLPTLQDYFFEFIEPGEWDAGERTCRQLHQLEPGRDYYVIVTTPSGLYRYFINDIVRVTGRFGMTPTIRFLQKGKGVTNITGEKLYESHVVEALGRARRHLQLQPGFYLMLADIEQQAYRLYLELHAATARPDELANCIDQALSELNEEYQAKRQSGRLKPVDVVLLNAGAGEAYRAHCLSLGQKEAQFKMVTLQYAHHCDFSFHTHVCEE